jgi:DNA-binding response OmpR family regulator
LLGFNAPKRLRGTVCFLREDWTLGLRKAHTTVNDRDHKVLIVDDEHTIADTLDAIFSASGYETRTSYSAEQALEIVVEWQPDLAILDVVLPKMNGIDLAIFLKAQCPDCRLLLFSGQPLTADLLAEAATKGHTFDTLAKPVHPTEMLERALKLLVGNQSNQAPSAST